MKIVLHQAFMWDCPECGTENWQRAIVLEPEDADRRGLIPEDADQLQLEALEELAEGYWVTSPTSVICSECKNRFKVARHDEDEKEDWET